MTIQEVKTKAGITGTLALVRQFNEKQEPQPWVSHWDNDRRIRVTMHDDVLKVIKDQPEFAGLALKHELVQSKSADKKPYDRFVVITPKNIEATF